MITGLSHVCARPIHQLISKSNDKTVFSVSDFYNYNLINKNRKTYSINELINIFGAIDRGTTCIIIYNYTRVSLDMSTDVY